MYIEPSTFQFLTDLRVNNNRDWFNEHRDAYEAAWQNMKDFTAAIIAGLAETDRYIPADLPLAKCLFRIYRDTRFSKDKTPYKEWLGAGISTAGRKLNGPEYYLHIAPGSSFVAGGYWRPEKEHLSAIRQEIDYNGAELRKVLQAPEFKKYLTFDMEDKLVKVPAGYDASHPDLEFLKLKSFTCSHAITDKELTKKGAVDKVLTPLRAMYGFKLFLHGALGDE
ncbi:TIGR02453 family protein [bacterium A37T11]|nr:TIGR02453 family protein [bacterium A37T11]